jgi:hypothetical protein
VAVRSCERALAQGFFVRPTLAEAPLDHPLWKQEMFLPILMLHRVSSNDAAMALANDSPLGLTAGFYGSADEVGWFNEHIEAGVTYANRPQGATTGAWPGYQAFGGWKGSGSTGKAIGIVINAIAAGLLALFGVFAGKGHAWAFLIGMVVIALDTVLVGLLQIWISLAIHIWALVSIFNGFRASRQLR